MNDFQTIDKSNFKTFRMEDGSVYFGEVAYIDLEGNPIENIEEVKAKFEEEKKARDEAEPPAEGEELPELV